MPRRAQSRAVAYPNDEPMNAPDASAAISALDIPILSNNARCGNPAYIASSLITTRSAREMMFGGAAGVLPDGAWRRGKALARGVQPCVGTAEQHHGHVRYRIPRALVELEPAAHSQ